MLKNSGRYESAVKIPVDSIVVLIRNDAVAFGKGIDLLEAVHNTTEVGNGNARSF